jgi:CBS domain-containing protein
VSPSELTSGIRDAARVEALVPLAASLRDVGSSMAEGGVAASDVTSFISTTNDLISSRIIELVMPDDIVPVDFCWIVMGSEGRYEQTLHTDQDNAIVFAADELAADEVRARLVPVARQVNEAMNLCGIPLCRGGIMASNPQWCLSCAEWEERFARWIDRSDPQALLNATIFFDFRALHGVSRLAEALRAWLAGRAQGHSRFLFQMTQNALGNRPPLGLFGGFVLATHGGVANALDLKVNAVTPLVDAARVYSLATGVTATGTVQRLREAAARGRIPEAQADACIEAFLSMQELRMRLQARALAGSAQPSNVVDPRTLDESSRRAIKTAMREAARLQKRIARTYASLGGYGV